MGVQGFHQLNSGSYLTLVASKILNNEALH